MSTTNILLVALCVITWVPCGAAAYWLEARMSGNPCATMSREERKHYTDGGEIVAALGPFGLILMLAAVVILGGAELCSSLGRRWLNSPEA